MLGPISSSIALAQVEPQPAQHGTTVDSTADRYFFEAKTKAAQKQWGEALALFEKAWELKPSHDIAGNLGQVALKLGRYTKAATFLQRCLRLFPPTGNADQRAQIQTLFESARAHVAQVKILVEPQSGELVLDRVTIIGPVTAPSEPVFVDPGTHIVQIRRDGQVLAEASFLAVANASHDVMVTPDSSRRVGAVAAPSSANSEPTKSHESANPNTEKADSVHARSAWPIVVGATVSVAGFVSAGLLFSAASNQTKAANDLIHEIQATGHGSGNDLCSVGTPLTAECQDLHSANERADSRYNWGYAMIGLGSASLIATLGYLLWPNSNLRPQSGSIARPLSVGFDVQPGAGRVRCLIQF